jgi:hypothetical protein
MSAPVNQHGVVIVGLMRGPKQHKRSLALIVAGAFIERPNEAFDTPIHLDGNRHNNDISNILWRPLWFARKFNKQFEPGVRACLGRPVEIIETGEAFENSLAAAKALGVIDREIAISVMTKDYVWPLYQHFRIVGGNAWEIDTHAVENHGV